MTEKDLERATECALEVLHEMGYKITSQNIHENCDNYNPKKDYCLKFFKKNISSLKECQEKTTFNDKELSRKWSN